MGTKNFIEAQLYTTKEHMESVRPDLSKISSAAAHPVTDAIAKTLFSGIKQVDELYRTNAMETAKQALQDTQTKIDNYQQDHPEMYESKEKFDAAQKELDRLTREAHAYIDGNKFVRAKDKTRLKDYWNTVDSKLKHETSAKFVAAYRTRTTKEALANSNRTYDKLANMVITPDNVKEYQQGRIDAANVLYQSYVTAGDGKQALPQIEKQEITLLKADVQNDINKAIRVNVTSLDDINGVISNLTTIEKSKASEIAGRVDTLMETDAYKDLKGEEKKRVRAELISSFTDQSKAMYEDEIWKQKQRMFKMQADLESSSSSSSDDDYKALKDNTEKDMQTVNNLVGQGNLTQAIFVATGKNTTPEDLVAAPGSYWKDGKDIETRLKTTDTYVPVMTTAEIASAKEKKKLLIEQGGTLIDAYNQIVVPLLDYKTKSERENIERQLSNTGIFNMSFIEVMRSNKPDSYKESRLTGMAQIEQGKTMQGPTTLGKAYIQDMPEASALFSGILGNGIKSKRFAQLLKARSLTDPNLMKNLDFTSNQSLTISAGKYFVKHQDEFAELYDIINVYKSKAYSPAKLNVDLLHFDIKARYESDEQQHRADWMSSQDTKDLDDMY